MLATRDSAGGLGKGGVEAANWSRSLERLDNDLIDIGAPPLLDWLSCSLRTLFALTLGANMESFSNARDNVENLFTEARSESSGGEEESWIGSLSLSE